ncbi:glycosyltransferase family 4 protein [Acinetobacter sp. SwsAc5]|uniref:glycosyltransferase family 4 protein n=1 Tax=Acinetobacter sp. SwsAc5 TaxID=2749438 RepID=UPI0015BE1684|nr:glycosyltransferase family 4 protein [Acinetobacter sp. SwsAc5]NWK53048.1 glycosyltransferase family 4 protein [Acinetobacter sp. SwsAc5]
MNILYLIPSLSNSGGMERVLTDKVNYLIKLGNYSITILTTDMKATESPFYELDVNIKVINLEIFFDSIFNLPLLKKRKESKVLLEMYERKLSKYILDNQVDICISMGAKELEFFSKLDVPVVKIFESHFNPTVRSSFIAVHKGSSLFWRILGKYRDWQYLQQTKNLDQVVVLTKNAQIEWKKTHNNVCLINNPSPFVTISDKIDFTEYKRAIAIGRLEDQKGFDLLIESWRNVYSKYPNWKLDIFGEGSKKNLLQKKINENNLDQVITLKGTTRNVQQELLTSDFYVMSSRYEGLPMVLLESISNGLPIVSFDCPTGPAEIIENNDCGILVLNGNINDLSEKIISVIENVDLRKKMSTIAIEKSKKYSIELIMRQWEQLFTEMLSNKARSK